MKTDLLTIPYIGKNTKQDLINIGITCVEDLKGKDPEELYKLDNEKKNTLKTNVNYTYLEWPFIMLIIVTGIKKN